MKNDVVAQHATEQRVADYYKYFSARNTGCDSGKTGGCPSEVPNFKKFTLYPPTKCAYASNTAGCR